MQGSIAIISGDSAARKQKVANLLTELGLGIGEGSPDVMSLEPLEGKRSIGIQQIRETKSFLSKKPFSGGNKAVVVTEGWKLTEEAQNALLKVLEEHSAYVSIIVCIQKESDLLPTVMSRCQQVKLQPKTGAVAGEGAAAGAEEGFSVSILDLLSETEGARLTQAEELAKHERDEIIETLKGWIGELRAEMVRNGAQNASGESMETKSMETILKVIADLEKTNVNSRLALEHLVLNIGN